MSASSGVIRWSGYTADTRLQAAVKGLTGHRSSSIFAETYSRLVESSLNTSETLGGVLAAVTLDTPFVKKVVAGAGGSDRLTDQFKQAAKVIKSRTVLGKVERDVFYVSMGGFDTHTDALNKVDELFQYTDHALSEFEKEMRLQGLWENVAVLQASEFGRTLRANGAGTDHAWGGHSFIVGGKLKGAQILGRYPDRIDNESPLNVRTGGRFIPTTSWEAVWHGLAEWFGVESGKMEDVLPQLSNFPSSALFKKEAMFDA